MSASKFCRNFLTFPQMGARENKREIHTTGERLHQNNDLNIQKTRDFHREARVNTEEQEHLDVPLVVVFFPESGKNQLDYRLGERTVQKKTKNIKPEHRLSTALQKGDSAVGDKGSSLNIDHGCNVEQKDRSCSSDEAVGGFPLSSPHHATNDHGTCFALCSDMECMFTLKLPPGSTLLSNRGVFHTTDKETPFACGYCGSNYKRKRFVYKHMRQKHEKHVTNLSQEKPLTCDQCGMRFRLETDLCRHKFMHSEESLFACNICNKSYTSKRELFSRSKVQKEQECREGVICNIWKKEFSNLSNLSEHMKIHTGEKPFKCSLCEKQFHVEIDFLQHMITHRETWKLLLGEKRVPEESTIKVPVQFSPSQCMKQFNHDIGKTEEKTIVFSSNNPFTCYKCGMSFRLESDLCRHQFTHTKKKRIPCKICSKSDTSKHDLFSHGEVNKEEEYREGFICSICKKEFCHQYILMEHMKRHSGEETFKCSLCDRHFPLNIYLQIHLLFHNKNVKLLPEDDQDPVESTINVPVQVAANQGIKQFNQDNSKTEEKIIQDNLYNKVVSDSKVAMVRESWISNTKGTNSNKRRGRGYPTKAVIGKWISVASGIVYENEVSSPNTSSSRFRHVDSVVSSKLPPGSTLVSDRGVYRINDKEKPFACGYCGKSYDIKRYVFKHIRYHHDEKCYSCEFCGKRYSEQCLLARHVRIHKAEKPFTCDQCGMGFRLQSGLRCHKFSHAEVRPFVCSICKKAFTYKPELIRHCRIHNRVECRGCICSICKKKFLKSTALKEHMTVHTGEKPFECSLCDRQFRLKRQLRYHMKTHCGEKMSADKRCSVCDKTFSASYLRAHMRMHTGEKPYQCNICGKRFRRKPDLKGHMRSHTGEKPFACCGCDKRFALYSNMRHHKAKCKKTSDNV